MYNKPNKASKEPFRFSDSNSPSTKTPPDSYQVIYLLSSLALLASMGDWLSDMMISQNSLGMFIKVTTEEFLTNMSST